MSVRTRSARRWIEAGIALVVLALVFMWSEGLFRSKVGPATGPQRAPERWSGRVAPVQRREIAIGVEAAGSVRPVRRADLSARVQGVLQDVRVRAGDRVRRGEILATLSVPELQSRAAAAEGAVSGAEAALAQARADADRVDRLKAREAATEEEWEHAKTGVARAEADLARAKETARAEATVASYGTLAAPFDGLVAVRSADPGDLASPGRVLLRIEDDSRFQLEAPVEERVGRAVKVGTVVTAVVEAAGVEAPSTIEEIVPAADPASRTILVKASLPAREGMRSGLYGRLRLPGATRHGLVVPSAAVERNGTLEFVRVVDQAGAIHRRLVRTGAPVGSGETEVLSGVAEGESVALPAGGPA